MYHSLLNLKQSIREWALEDLENEISREDRTVKEVLKMMNCINGDLKFTAELETDFESKRLPTLSFELWSEKGGLRHSYYEKPMRAQI